MAVEAYEALIDELALLRDVRTAEEQISSGRTVDHATVAKNLRERLGG
jgi:hypothetical protein